ncbi:MAG: peptidoglycan editing factor PgeF [Gammaproteobacteria bacterium]|nr:MAG: peptidoglycan editing factor PgeF [Gammaproteobacteria bacterium]
MTEPVRVLRPAWPVPARIQAASTTRVGGTSRGDFAGLNLAVHVGDDPAAVGHNRALLREALGLPAEPLWLSQVHGRNLVDAARAGEGTEADASFTTTPGVVCAVMTADCLPVLFADLDGRQVAAAHAGWRGLAGGVLETTLARFEDPSRVIAWLGPAIGPRAFEVGDEVRAAFCEGQAEAVHCFRPARPGHWLADIYALARLRLFAAGIGEVYGGGRCTYSEPEMFYSYRRSRRTGRMASLIWIEEAI